MSKQKSKLFYVATVGILSYMIADILHEVVGHGGTGLILGNKIALLTSVYFKSSPGNIFVDIGGPLSNLIFGGLALYILRKRSLARLLFFQVAAYNLFWFSGTILHSAISETGDWTFALKAIVTGPFAKFLLAVLGISSYVLVIRYLNAYLNATGHELRDEPLTKQDIFISFLFAAMAASLAGLFYRPDRLHAALEGLLEMVASLPILFLTFNTNASIENHTFRGNYYFCLTVCVVYIFFCLTLGKGIS